MKLVLPQVPRPHYRFPFFINGDCNKFFKQNTSKPNLRSYLKDWAIQNLRVAQHIKPVVYTTFVVLDYYYYFKACIERGDRKTGLV